jgi:hypothetical protein
VGEEASGLLGAVGRLHRDLQIHERKGSMSMMERVAPSCEPTFRTSAHFVHALSGSESLESNIGSSAKKTRSEVIHLKSWTAGDGGDEANSPEWPATETAIISATRDTHGQQRSQIGSDTRLHIDEAIMFSAL